jgi:thiol-disulfide isomerase/thioredoxin
VHAALPAAILSACAIVAAALLMSGCGAGSPAAHTTSATARDLPDNALGIVASPASFHSHELRTERGARVRLDRPSGKLTVVNIFASWCDGCREEAADLRAFAQKHPGVRMYGVAADDAPAAARAFAQAEHWGYDVVDDGGRFPQELGIVGKPGTAVIDGQGRVRARIFGRISEEELGETVLRIQRQIDREQAA